MTHKTKDGRLIPIKELSDDHLDNIINMNERRAREGIVVRYGSKCSCTDDVYYVRECLRRHGQTKQEKRK